MSIYIHIPFCTNICTYCDFTKLYKNEKWIKEYLKALDKEIKEKYKKEKIKTLYIGGGTPSCLDIEDLKTLFKILEQINLTKDPEITMEFNIEDLTEEKLKYLKTKINRLSIGVQTFDKDLIKLLNRKTPDINKIKLAKKYFKNISVDLMYNFNEETKNILTKDLNTLIKLNIPHISTYSLILEKGTILYNKHYKIKNQTTNNEEIINKTLKENNYIHYEISNYAKENYQSKHNLTYWNNEEYYGFGLGASGYINNIRYTNTKNLFKYLNNNYIAESHKLDINENIQNEFILGLRKLKGININKFKQKYNIDPLTIKEVKDLVEQKLLIKNKNNLYINPKYLYVSNEILINFIDLKVK